MESLKVKLMLKPYGVVYLIKLLHLLTIQLTYGIFVFEININSVYEIKCEIITIKKYYYKIHRLKVFINK